MSDNVQTLTVEELDLVNAFRERKAKEVAAKQKELERKENGSKLEKEFRRTITEVSAQIKEKLDRANTELKAAVSLSDEFGVPFYSGVEGMPQEREYSPKSFVEKWGDIDDKVMSDEGVYLDRYNSGRGWKYWRMSTIECS